MPPTSIRAVVADTGFWIEAFDPKGKYHAKAANFLEDLRDTPILLPWPIMYEVLRTKTVKDKRMTESFRRVLAFRKIVRVPDTEYQPQCLEETFVSAMEGRPLSLVDMVVRAVLKDTRFRIARLLTFNVGDFQDICSARNITIWP